MTKELLEASSPAILVLIDWPSRVKKGFLLFVMYAFGPRLIWTKAGSQSMTVDVQDVRK